MRHNIVVGVDGSENSFVALSAAADLAEQTSSQLTVVFVHDSGAVGAFAAAYESTAERLIEETVSALEVTSRERTFDVLADRPVDWIFDIAVGDPAHELIKLAKERTASVIVVGGRVHSLLGGLIVGSVAQKLLRSSPISVLVVRRPAVENAQSAGLQESAP
jgi:nucleotide-binding universal stress UspA family protein